MAENTKTSDAPVAAREQADQINSPGGSAGDALEQRAKEQETQQRQALGSSLSGAAHDAVTKEQAQASDAPAAARQGAPGTVPTQNGFMVQESRRIGADVLEGLFVTCERIYRVVVEASD